ncbi:MAG: class A beta-lactamase, partial [Pseudomonadota bacterium]
KSLLGGLILTRVDAGLETLERSLTIRESDLVFHSPTTSERVGSSLTIAELCAATIANSDNAAANLLLQSMGGPEGFTQALRTLGDQTTRLDRYEPEMNENLPGDPRDTTTPLAMTDTLQAMLFGDWLRPESRHILFNWMLGATTGAGRLTAGLPDGWDLGHKTGTSWNGVNNDVGFALPQTGRPIMLISLSDGPEAMSPEADEIHAAFARAAIATLRG